MFVIPPAHITVPHANAYLVGGSVRDLIHGRAPLDYDICVEHNPRSYAAKLAKGLGSRVIRMGKEPFTVYRVVSGKTCVDVAQMNGSSIEADLKSRDFTINALASDMDSGLIIDPTGGLDDMKLQMVRMVSPQALTADPIRLLRAYRMAAVMQFEIVPQTVEAITLGAVTIKESAGERILSELYKIMACAESHRQIIAMAQSGLLSAVFPELIPLETCRQNRHHTGNVMNHTLTAYRQMENLLDHPQDMLPDPATRFIASLDRRKQILLKLAILLHDIGKPDSRQIDQNGELHFYGHADGSVALLQPICQRLRMSNGDRDFMMRIVGLHQRPLDLFLSANRQTGRISPKATGRFFRQCGDLAPAVLLHALADNLGKKESAEARLKPLHRSIIDLLSSYFERIQHKLADQLIDGNDLIKYFGLPPSPLFGSILGQIEEAYLAGSIQNRDQALEWVADMIDQPPVA